MSMPQPEADAARKQLALNMMQMSEIIAPVFDTADGMRAELEKRGWSPTAAEAAALEWLRGTLGAIGTGGPQ